MFALRNLLRAPAVLNTTARQLPVYGFATLSGKASHDDFKPKSKVKKDTNYEEIEQLLKKIVTEHPVMLFMKGTPQAPVCGFSLRAVNILKKCGSDFASANVLNDSDLRMALKKFSDWDTFPQLYIGGEFIGGCDIMTQMYESGELQKLLNKVGAIKPMETEAPKK